MLEMLGLKPEDLVVLPEPKRERLDMSRMRVYAVSKAEDAMGQFKTDYGTLPLYCIIAPIGGRKKCDAWLCGPTPSVEDAASPAAPSAEMNYASLSSV